MSRLEAQEHLESFKASDDYSAAQKARDDSLQRGGKWHDGKTNTQNDRERTARVYEYYLYEL